MSKKNTYIPVACIMPAAGKGLRLKSKTPKPLITLERIPLVVWTLKSLVSAYRFKEIILPVDKGMKTKIVRLVSRYGFRTVRIVAGGATRAQSVHNAFKAMDTKVDVVLIHDMARPFIDKNSVNELVSNTLNKGVSLLAEGSTSTVKLSNSKRQYVSKTLDRNKIYLAQTPQVFKKNILGNIYKTLGRRISKYTDEASMAEAVGWRVWLVEGPSTNFKITKPRDLDLAKAMIRYRLNLEK